MTAAAQNWRIVYGGPWAVGTENGCNANTVYDCHGNSVACVYDIPMHRDVDEVRDAPGLPKARLIAAAPDLVEALKSLLPALLPDAMAKDKGGLTPESRTRCMAIVKAALSKAGV